MKRLLSLLLCLAVILGTAGCASDAHPAGSLSETEAVEPVELEWYVNYSWYNTPWGGNAVSDAITERTGVDITFISPGGSETETLDALIAGNNLPDLVTLGVSPVSGFLAARSPILLKSSSKCGIVVERQ